MKTLLQLLSILALLIGSLLLPVTYGVPNMPNPIACNKTSISSALSTMSEENQLPINCHLDKVISVQKNFVEQNPNEQCTITISRTSKMSRQLNFTINAQDGYISKDQLADRIQNLCQSHLLP